MSGPETYEVRRLGEMQRAFGGALARVRAELGITAFGVQVVDLPPSSGDLAPEHDHRHDGQEELYLLLAGSAEVVVPDGTVELGAETFVRLGPSVRRRIRSGPTTSAVPRRRRGGMAGRSRSASLSPPPSSSSRPPTRRSG
ncbi:MAG: hypothetical protein ABSG43_15135 [Solirubrobacteraceae bacterium]